MYFLSTVERISCAEFRIGPAVRKGYVRSMHMIHGDKIRIGRGREYGEIVVVR